MTTAATSFSASKIEEKRSHLPRHKHWSDYVPLIGATALAVLLMIPTITNAQEESRCYGSPDNGRLENGWQLPNSGKNYSIYSPVGVVSRRNYVHSKVYKLIIDAYAIMEQKSPSKVFVYGESGFREGGKFWPHKTHQTGLSVDFFVPVLDETGRSVPLPTSIANKFGYSIEFVDEGEYNGLHIDYPAMARHLWALKAAADKHGVKIWRVIFDNQLQKQLFKTTEAAGLREAVEFSTKKPWVRHDEHYHVDFIVPCEPLQ
jgi:penicillin-insensitive murein endopeptidase